MTNLTTIAALPMGAGCLSRLEPEVWKRAKDDGGWEYEWGSDSIVNKRTGQRVSGIECMQNPEKWADAMALASLGYKVNAQGTIERL